MKKRHTMKFFTAEDIDDHEVKLVVNSPRSVEACMREGIKPKDLLFVPEEEFIIQGMPDDIKQMHFAFFEAKRKELLYNVRRTRKNIISEQDAVTRSSTAFFQNSVIFNREPARNKAVKVKMINEIVDRECFLQEVIKERENEFNLTLQNNFSQSIEEAEQAKTRYDRNRTFHLERLKKNKKVEETNEKMKRLMEGNYLKKIEKIIEMNEKKLRIIEEKKEENEAKAKHHCAKMESFVEKIHKLRRNAISQCDLKVKERLEAIINEKVKRQQYLERKWNEKIKRKDELKKRIKQEILNRQIEYYNIKEIEDKRYEEIILQNEKPKECNAQREKIVKTSEYIQNDLKQRQKRIELKQTNFNQRLEKQRDEASKKAEFRQTLEQLKKQKMVWNIQRIQNKHNYSKSMFQLKHRQKIQYLREKAIQKSTEVNKKLMLNSQIENRNHKLDEEILKMSITNLWNKAPLLTILNSDEPIF